MVEPAILTEETGGSEIERCQVENQMASDLYGDFSGLVLVIVLIIEC